MSSGATITSPTLTPMRNSMRRFCGRAELRAPRIVCTSTAQRTALTAAKLHEHAITGVLDDAAAIMADLRLDDLAPIGQQAEMSALLVGAREPRIADHVGS